MARQTQLQHKFVELMPPALEEGVLYISGEYATVTHLCCCGCGERVVTPLSPAQWRMQFDGEAVSLSPSIGNGSLDCNSHYWIRESKVLWAKPLSADVTQRSQWRDRQASIDHFQSRTSNDDNTSAGTRRRWMFWK